MDLTLPLGLAAGLFLLALFAGWRGSRPPNPHKEPRLVPWRFIMLASAACLFFILAYIGQQTGVIAGPR
ncbi:hypothetical protein [Phenylobacterium sp.]|uniref:hypothetical protein n=1 Tax=Phenylobacterium sp. TaxID=1871053 RepID=UPI001228837E|nr:hypothetical protein [Phenylobacterium sp.]THD64751.1 MAG: hypothetical protein E8A49_01505 [Phenylobacterium sp.]